MQSKRLEEMLFFNGSLTRLHEIASGNAESL